MTTIKATFKYRLKEHVIDFDPACPYDTLRDTICNKFAISPENKQDFLLQLKGGGIITTPSKIFDNDYVAVQTSKFIKHQNQQKMMVLN